MFFFSIWSIVGLWGYHSYLICRSVTTNEDIKGTWDVPDGEGNLTNPFSRGHFWSNCVSILCGPLPPSFLNLRATVKEENNIPMNNNLPVYHLDDNRISNNNRVWNSSVEQQHRYVSRDYV